MLSILRRAEEEECALDYINKERLGAKARPGARQGLDQDEAWSKRRPRSKKGGVTGGPNADGGNPSPRH